jgi:hypothetical protein
MFPENQRQIVGAWVIMVVNDYRIEVASAIFQCRPGERDEGRLRDIICVD